jgi:hypothetical protein
MNVVNNSNNLAFMENHPIPQDVTGFEFKLIGDMTVKQFAYLAVAAITGWVVFSLPISYFFSLPVAAICVIIGISLAFIPIAGRPTDVMLTNFIKSLFTPTQYVYRKLDATSYFLSQSQVIPKANPILSAQPTDEEKSEELQKKEHVLEEKLKEVEEKEKKLKEEELSKNRMVSPEAHQKLLALEGALQEMVSQKEQLSRQIINLQRRLNVQKRDIFTPSMAQPIPQTQNVRTIPTGMGKGLGLPTTPTVPNIVTGIVKDPRGNPLSNILVEIKDKEDNPVRAFKTSQLGHFASSTPLQNGVYTITFEDPKTQNKFDAIELNVKNEVIMPIEVISIIDPREELRRSLFAHKA